MAGLRAKITKRAVDSAVPPATGEAWIWDTELKGFFLRLYSTGRKVYAVKCRVGARQRIHTIGAHGSPWTPEKAREAAQDALRAARKGEDPNAPRKAAREALTVSQLIDRYLEDGPATKPAKRASTWAIDASNLNRHVRPLLGSKIANAVTRSDAAKAVRDISVGKTARDERTGPRGRARVSGGEGTARRTRTTAAAMFAWGMEHGLCHQNPFAGVKLAAAPTRERFLSKDEAGRFLEALADLERLGELSSTFADALRLLLLTGARKSEILGLRWAEVDLDRSILVLPPERTKAGGQTGARRIRLSAPAAELLARRGSHPGRHAAHVFPAATGDGHAIGLRRAFLKACARASVDGLRIHDLRHSFASFAIANGASLFLISKLLGHASARTTERYAHLQGDPLQDVADQVARVIDRAAAQAPETADVASPNVSRI